MLCELRNCDTVIIFVIFLIYFCFRNIQKNEEKIKNLEKEYAGIDETKIKLQAERDKCVNQAREYLDKQEETQVMGKLF